MMLPDQEQAIRRRITEQVRLEQVGDAASLCELVLPAYRSTPADLAGSMGSFREFAGRIRSAELMSFEVERWELSVERAGGALVGTQVRYNGSSEPASLAARFGADNGTHLRGRDVKPRRKIRRLKQAELLGQQGRRVHRALKALLRLSFGLVVGLSKGVFFPSALQNPGHDRINLFMKSTNVLLFAFFRRHFLVAFLVNS